MLFLATDLITLTIKYDGKQEQIKCWYTDVATLNFNRVKTSDEALLAKLKDYSKNLKEAVQKKDDKLQEVGYQNY